MASEKGLVFLNIIKKLDWALEKIQSYILVITGTAVGVMILVNAFFRVIKFDWFGSEELTMFVAFWLYFTGAACASRENTHISADMVSLFTDNPKIRAAVDVVKTVIGVAMSAVFTYWCFNYVSWQANLGAKSSVYKLPVIINTIPILIFFALWTLYLIRDLVVAIQVLFGKKPTNVNAEGGK